MNTKLLMIIAFALSLLAQPVVAAEFSDLSRQQQRVLKNYEDGWENLECLNYWSSALA